MLTIDKSNNITLTRGDTLTLTVSLLKDNELSRNTIINATKPPIIDAQQVWSFGFDTASA